MRSSDELELRRRLTDLGDGADIDPHFEHSMHLVIDGHASAATTSNGVADADGPGRARRRTFHRLVPLAGIAAAVAAITTAAVMLGQTRTTGPAAAAPTTSTTVVEAGPVEIVTSRAGQGPTEEQTIAVNAQTLETVAGKIVNADGTGLGGVRVTVSGDGPSTMTLTSGDIGAFQLVGLSVPGKYTLTFTLAGYADRTEVVTLVAGGPPATVQVTLDPLTTGAMRGATGR